MSDAGANAAARLFVAIDIPPDVQRRLLALVPVAPGVRRVASGQVHLTLHFLGDVAATAVAPLATALDRVAWNGFPLLLAGGGRFPPRGPASVLWVGVRASDGLADLHAAIGDVLVRHGQAVETRPYLPHVTLARVQRHAGRGLVAAFLRAAAELEPLAVAVERFHLYRSDRGPGGQVHAIVRSCAAGG